MNLPKIWLITRIVGAIACFIIALLNIGNFWVVLWFSGLCVANCVTIFISLANKIMFRPVDEPDTSQEELRSYLDDFLNDIDIARTFEG